MGKKGREAPYSFSDLKHGKVAEDGMHMSKLKHKSKMGGAKPQTSGHIDDTKPEHDAKHMNIGSRGPFTSAGKGKHKAK